MGYYRSKWLTYEDLSTINSLYYLVQGKRHASLSKHTLYISGSETDSSSLREDGVSTMDN